MAAVIYAARCFHCELGYSPSLLALPCQACGGVLAPLYAQVPDGFPETAPPDQHALHLDQLRARVERLETALRQYADRGLWNRRWLDPSEPSDYEDWWQPEEDGWALAELALGESSTQSAMSAPIPEEAPVGATGLILSRLLEL